MKPVRIEVYSTHIRIDSTNYGDVCDGLAIFVKYWINLKKLILIKDKKEFLLQPDIIFIIDKHFKCIFQDMR